MYIIITIIANIYIITIGDGGPEPLDQETLKKYIGWSCVTYIVI